MKLNRYFTNPFLSPRISNEELQVFTEDNLVKMEAADGSPHDLASLITDTGAAYTAYFGELTNVSLRNAVKKAATQEMYVRWDALVKWITTSGEARVIDKAGKPSMTYTEFFPGGLSEFHNATVGGAQTLAARLQTTVDAHSETMLEDFTTTATGLIDSYEAARQLQMEYKGAEADTRGNRDEKKAVLQTQLFKNLLSLALLEMDPGRASLYFSQHLLEDPDYSPDEEPEPEPVP